jgi:hypothetical protein
MPQLSKLRTGVLAVVLWGLTMGAWAPPVFSSPVSVFEDVVDTQLKEARKQLRDLESSHPVAVRRLLAQTDRLRNRVQSNAEDRKWSTLDRLLSGFREARERVRDWREDLREDVDDQLVDLHQDGVDWDDFREKRGGSSGSRLPGHLEAADHLETVETIDRLFDRGQTYLTLSVQIRATDEEDHYQHEYIRRGLTRSFRDYLTDQIRGPGSTVAARTYRGMIRVAVAHVEEQSDTVPGSTQARALGHTLLHQGRVLLELSPGRDETDRVLDQINGTVQRLLPGSRRDRFEALDR